MENDAFQLSHYTRMLQTLGHHVGRDLVGGIIGQSDYTDLGGGPWLVAWYDLGTPPEGHLLRQRDRGPREAHPVVALRSRVRVPVAGGGGRGERW